METTAVQQDCSEVDPIQEQVKLCKEVLLAQQIESPRKTLLVYCAVFAQQHNDLGRTSLIQPQIKTENHSPIKQASRRVPMAKHEETNLAGPFPMSQRGNRHILVVADHFSKWCDAYPVPIIDDPKAAKLFVKNWTSHYGASLELIAYE